MAKFKNAKMEEMFNVARERSLNQTPGIGYVTATSGYSYVTLKDAHIRCHVKHSYVGNTRVERVAWRFMGQIATAKAIEVMLEVAEAAKLAEPKVR